MSLPLPTTSPSPPAVPAVVIDTNVVFDWLVFRNAGCQPLIDAVEAGHLRWISTAEMRHELLHVIGRGVIANYNPDLAVISATWERLCQTVEPPLPTLVPKVRCTDRDDQKFIDLALHAGRWLITRDRAVLKLGRKAAAFGVVFTTPEKWAQGFTTAG